MHSLIERLMRQWLATKALKNRCPLHATANADKESHSGSWLNWAYNSVPAASPEWLFFILTYMFI